ncbi:predicted protein [Naegleria gruberi]|uniref:Predicted protein n=1 Tax=Naegleria gruberi TaxID=5762 RepID=D2V5T5_NAEGR|nr:uncharacterized protein NAEGRDRAFT_64196 [Naegleria gruberi]EFC47851.1 predicted protein [Naegleria gruberi]|eukprot:XP_002680595.1 predicted protein [Naegleria gruberi strain NEG-M]
MKPNFSDVNIQYSSDHDDSNNHTIVSSSLEQLLELLKCKFRNQQFYKMKYLTNRWEFSKNDEFTPIEFMGDKEFYWIKVIIHKKYSIADSLENVNGDSNLMLQFIRECPYLLEQASYSLRNDREFIFKAIEVNYLSYNYSIFKDPILLERYLEIKNSKIDKTQPEINYKKCNDDEMILKAIESNAVVIQKAPKKFKKEKSMVLKVVSRNVKTLSYLSNQFKKDRDVIMEAINKNAYKTLEIISPFALKLMDDKDLILMAINRGEPFALRFASKRLKNDKQVVMAAIQQTGSALSEASTELQNDREIAMTAVTKTPYAYEWVSSQLRKTDRELALKAVQGDGLMISCVANTEFKLDLEIALTALSLSGRALVFTESKLRTNEEFILEAIKRNGFVLKYVVGYIPSNRISEEMILQAIYQNGFSLNYSIELLRARMNNCYPELYLPSSSPTILGN